MTTEILKVFDLQLFAGEGGAGAGAGDGGFDGGDTGVQMREDAAPATRRASRRGGKFEGVTFGIPEEPAQSRAAAGSEPAEEQQAEETYESLIKGKYKADHDAYIAKLMDGRFKAARQTERRLGQMQPIVEELAKHYNVQSDDLAGLMDRLSQDKRFYEEQALREGVPVELIMQREQLNRRQAAIDAQERRYQQESQRRLEDSRLLQQAVQLKAEIPEFDLDAELNNPVFKRMVRESGVPVRAAYYAVNHDKLEEARRQQQAEALRSVARDTVRKVSNAVASGSHRPVENGVGSNAAGTIRSDPSLWTREERREVNRRAHRGERIRI